MQFILRPWRPQDAPALAQYADNLKIAQNLRDTFPHPYTLDDARTFIQDCLDNCGSSLFRAIEADGQAVGSISLSRGCDVYQKNAELGYWLAENYWGRGIMPQAVRLMCQEGFSRWDIVRIYAEPYAHNSASRRVLEKTGFSLEGTLRHSVFKQGRLCDACMYALLRDEFLPYPNER